MWTFTLLSVSRIKTVLIIRHNHVNGTIVDGTQKGDPSLAILKQHGFKWSRQIGVAGAWYLRGTRDHMARRYVIDQTAETLRKAGIEVTVEIDDTPRDATERHDDYVERVEDRQEALEDKADQKHAEGAAAYKHGTDALGLIPLGQPILVGHYSEGRDRLSGRDSILTPPAIVQKVKLMLHVATRHIVRAVPSQYAVSTG